MPNRCRSFQFWVFFPLPNLEIRHVATGKGKEVFSNTLRRDVLVSFQKGAYLNVTTDAVRSARVCILREARLPCETVTWLYLMVKVFFSFVSLIWRCV